MRACAAAYDPGLHEAPLVVGHPASDAPAYGWVRALNYDETLGLEAEPHQVHSEFAELVAAGSYKKISASFYPPNSSANPKPGAYYLRHVGFLGATPPSLKGLRAAEFADESGELVTVELEFGESAAWGASQTLWRRMREWVIAKFGLEAADSAVPGYVIDRLGEESRPEFAESPAATPQESAVNAEEAKRAEELAVREKALADREKKLAEQERAAERREFAEWTAAQVASGRLLPAEAAPVTELLLSLPGGQELAFGEGDEAAKKAPRAILQDLVTALPARVEFAELAAADGKAAPARRYRAPEGYDVDPRQAELHGRALAYAETHKVDYEVALAAVVA